MNKRNLLVLLEKSFVDVVGVLRNFNDVFFVLVPMRGKHGAEMLAPNFQNSLNCENNGMRLCLKVLSSPPSPYAP